MTHASAARHMVAVYTLAASVACTGSREDEKAVTDSLPAVPQSGDTASVAGDAPWRTVKSGSDSAGFALAPDGTLSWSGRPLTPALALRDAGDAGSPIVYHVSPSSPSGRWALAHGRSNTFGRVYVLDLEQGTTRETPATKYGIIPWVAWAPTLPYAVVSNWVEGSALLYRIDLTTGEARPIDFTSVVAPPLSATPIESSLRWLDEPGAVFSMSARVACNSAVERCEGAPGAEMRRYHIDLRALQVRPL